MARISFQRASFMKMSIWYYTKESGNSITGYLSLERIDEGTIPEGWYMYDIREGDYDEPATIENHVMVDYFGTFLTSQKLDIPEEGYLSIRDWYIDTEEK